MANLTQEPQPGLLGSAPGTPGYNPAWYAATTIFIDPVAGSDAADGTTSGAPIKTWAEAVRRWGTTEPEITNATGCAVTFLSNSPALGTDPVVWKPIMTGGGVPTIQGTAPASVAAVFTRSAQKNRTAGANALLAGSFSAGAPAPGLLVQNTTAGKSSRAIIYKTAGGANWNLSQPLVPATLPVSGASGPFPVPVEVDTWASTDTVNVLTLVQIDIAVFQPQCPNFNAAFQNVGQIYQAHVFDPSGNTGQSVMAINDGVSVVECVVDRATTPFNQVGGSAAYFSNSWMNGGIFDNAAQMVAIGGILASTASPFVNSFGGGTMFADGDVIIAGTLTFFGGSVLALGLVYMDANLRLRSGSSAIFETLFYGSHVLYGGAAPTLAFQQQSTGELSGGTYASGWTAATLVAAGVFLNASQLGNSIAYAGAVGTIHNGIATTVANLDAAAGAAGFGGTAFNLGGASVSNQ